MSIIEKGLREKVRFNLNGNVTIEDLYDFNSEKLAALGSKLFEQVKTFTSTNPFKTLHKTKAQERVQLEYDIVKYIYDVKVSEEEESANASIKKQEKEKLLTLLAKKQDEKLGNLTEEEIQAKLANL